ncbi:MAG TPA: 50S ribosomal protein L25/general stress protein Ctc [Rhizomicrobium sp.]|nr:50S ribosomal protein L25/general stress protein Ctc [Rhizomicrobium sp.]
MRQMQDLSADPRPGTGKGPSYQTRKTGRIPAVVYGGPEAPENVSVDSHTLGLHVDQGGFLTRLFMLDVAGKKQRVIPRQVQLDPVTDRPVHVDFMRLAPGAKIKLAIPVRFKGHEASPGLKRGGVLNIVRHEIEMLLDADHIPDALEGDLSGLDIHGTLHFNDFKLPEGAKTTIREENFTVASIVAPTSVIEEQKAAAAAAAAAASAPVAEEGVAPAEGAAAGAAPAAAAKAPEKK